MIYRRKTAEELVTSIGRAEGYRKVATVCFASSLDIQADVTPRGAQKNAVLSPTDLNPFFTGEKSIRNLTAKLRYREAAASNNSARTPTAAWKTVRENLETFPPPLPPFLIPLARNFGPVLAMQISPNLKHQRGISRCNRLAIMLRMFALLRSSRLLCVWNSERNVGLNNI